MTRPVVGLASEEALYIGRVSWLFHKRFLNAMKEVGSVLLYGIPEPLSLPA